MYITVNGETQKLNAKKTTITKLLELQKNVEAPEMVAVQLNGEFVEVKDYTKTILKKNDSVEFLHFMGGGEECAEDREITLEDRYLLLSNVEISDIVEMVNRLHDRIKFLEEKIRE